MMINNQPSWHNIQFGPHRHPVRSAQEEIDARFNDLAHDIQQLQAAVRCARQPSPEAVRRLGDSIDKLWRLIRASEAPEEVG